MVLIDASGLGEKVKEGKNQKTFLNTNDETQIINTFKNKEVVDNFSVVVSYEDIQTKNYSFSAGQFFSVKIPHMDISQAEFKSQLKTLKANLEKINFESQAVTKKIFDSLESLKIED